MQKFETRTSQFELVGGIRQQASDQIVVAEPGSLFAPEARKGKLYLLVEADADLQRGRQACQIAARTVRRVFYEDDTFSVTAALRKAVSAANKAVYQHNFSQSATQRAQVGITVAVLKDSDLFVAQVQPAQAYVLSEGKLRALPAHPSWDPAHVSVAPFTRTGALGTSLFVEPELYRCTLHPPDGAILCSSDFARLLGRDEIDRLLRLQDGATAIERLLQIAGQQDLADARALAIELLPQLSPAAQRDPLSPTGVSERGQLAARSLRGWFGGFTGEAALALRGRRKPVDAPKANVAAPDPLHTMPEQPQHSATPPARPAPLDIGAGLDDRYERSRQERDSKQRTLRERRAAPADPVGELPPSAYLGEEAYPAPSRSIDLGDGPALAANARPYKPRYELRPLIDLSWGERLALPFRRLGVAIGDTARSRKPRRAAPPRPITRGQGLSYRRTRPAFPWLLLVGLALVVTALIFYGLTLSRQNDQQLALEYFTAAESRLGDVRAAADEGAALEALDLSRQAIDEVRASPNVTDTNPPLWLRYQELQREYERALAAVQRQTFFDAPVVLATHPLPTGRFASVVVPPPVANVTDTNQIEALRYIYALGDDAGNARLYRIPREGGSAKADLSPNETVGTTVVGPLRAALWRIDQVVAVDQAPSGFGYYFRNGGAWNYSKLGGSEIWTVRDRLDIEEYDGNLYVWDAEPGEVLRFRSGFYGDTPDYWLDPAGLADLDLSTVVDMDVNISIYLLRANGTVLVFSAGQPVGEVKPEAITPPINGVTRFVVTGDSPEEGAFFMIDPRNERIIQIDKISGHVIQQIKVRPDGDVRLDQLGGLAVDDSGSRPVLYLVNSGQIIRAELPAPPRAFRDDATPAPSTRPTQP